MPPRAGNASDAGTDDDLTHFDSDADEDDELGVTGGLLPASVKPEVDVLSYNELPLPVVVAFELVDAMLAAAACNSLYRSRAAFISPRSLSS